MVEFNEATTGNITYVLSFLVVNEDKRHAIPARRGGKVTGAYPSVPSGGPSYSFRGMGALSRRYYSEAMTPALSAQAKADAPVELRNAVRFPLQIPLRLFTAGGEIPAMTENISATGVAFTLTRPLEVHTQVRFTMKMPSEAMGTPTDVVVHCTGRVVRCNTSDTCWRAAAVIDEYYFSQ